LIELFFHHPIIGALVIAAIAFVYYLNRNNPVGGQTSSNVPAATLDDSEKQSAISSLVQHDPNFDEQAFYQRVGVAFNKIQAAWCAQNLSVVRPFISDGVHERFTLQFSEQKAEGWHDQMDNIQVQDIEIAELRSDGLFDELSVRIAASALDYRVSLASGKRLGGATAPDQFVEVWSFLRHRGAVTQPGKSGLIEGNCPNCGAPVELNQSANCTHCKAMLRSGQYDWVLSEITQEVEWDGERHGQLPGVAALRNTDPEFNAVELEDRASVMFWRKATADRIGKIDPLRKAASEAFCQAYAPAIHPSPDGHRQFFADCAIGSVQLLGVMSAASGDRAVVEVRWSGKLVGLWTNQPPRVLEENHLEYTLLVLWRAAGTKTDSGKGISSAHCPNCGAPESNDASNACEFCGAVLNDGAHGWILVDLANKNEARGNQLLAELNSGAAG
ncbi:MAG TPA: Tim44 domain-containing protein, partial [Tepidisphaeraceae bacterium]|nr:Tim44 domain-containing protein [Tepidisphaeraceae bacterium]